MSRLPSYHSSALTQLEFALTNSSLPVTSSRPTALGDAAMADTDRELLELAAKAAGIVVQWDCPERGMMMLTPDGIDTMSWNPLTDDGDALRLAVKLRIQVTPGTYNKDEFSAYNGERHAEAHEWYAPGVQDECAATRRAIVRAAAAIGGGK